MTATAERLPAIVAVLRRHDSGEFGNAVCPHCEAQGRYINFFVCEDGSRRGAMDGCIKLFPTARGPVARLTAEAQKRAQLAEREGKRLASWWADIVDVTAALERGEVEVETLRAVVVDAEHRRQSWLNRNGYGRRGGYARRTA